MNGMCYTHGRDEKCVKSFDMETRREELDVKYDENIKIDLREIGWE
jgi:hypothetical protein